MSKMCNKEADNKWSEKNLKKIFSKETIMLHASGDDGQAPGRCCRLCGGDRGLRRFGETYVWEGVEERYDQLLHQCFGVKVKRSGSMICDRCVHHLRNAERFKALVHAAFDKTPSAFSSNCSIHKVPNVINNHSNPRALETEQPKENKRTSNESLKIVDLLNCDDTKENVQNKRIPKRREGKDRGDKKPFLSKVKQAPKRVTVFCTVCKQRYQMILPIDECKNFICSRCRMNKGCKESSICQRCNFTVPSNKMQQHLNMHSKANTGIKNNRKCNLVIKVSRTALHGKSKNTTYRKLNQEHRNGTILYADSTPCACEVCDRKFNNKDLLEKHMWRVHVGQSTYQCQMCNDEFKTKKELLQHELRHRRLFKI